MYVEAGCEPPPAEDPPVVDPADEQPASANPPNTVAPKTLRREMFMFRSFAMYLEITFVMYSNLEILVT
jgi:hypothetical protein